jgi:hypothetical protein
MKFRFTTRDLFWLILVLAISLSWYLDRDAVLRTCPICKHLVQERH